MSDSSLKLENFLPTYSFTESELKLFSSLGKASEIKEGAIENVIIDEKIASTFYNETYLKKEFNDTKLEKIEEKPKKAGIQLKHQEFVSKFFSPYTPYDKGLIFHEVGTGKTCSAIGLTILAKEINPSFNRALILVRSDVIAKNFIKELVNTCTPGTYLPENFQELSDKQKVTRINKLVSADYEIHTFETFASHLKKLSDDRKKEEYSNRVIIIDEAHNIRYYSLSKIEKTKEKLDIYREIHKMLHLVQNIRVLLLTATPMRDKPSELAAILNLILPLSKQIPYFNKFNERFILPDKTINTNELAPYLIGIVSYVKSMKDTKTINEGQILDEFSNVNGPFKKFIIQPVPMLDLQLKIYQKAYNEDKKTSKGEEPSEEEDKTGTGLYSQSREATLFVYPTDEKFRTGIYGREGYKKYVSVTRSKHKITSSSIFTASDLGGEEKIIKRAMKSDLKAILMTGTKKSKTVAENEQIILDNISKCSNKYRFVIEKILQNPKFPTFVYSRIVNGSGAIIFSLLLSLFGYTESDGIETTKGKRYAVLTGETSSGSRADKIQKYFNTDDNKHGEYLQVIIGSQIIGEGTSFLNIRQIFNITPHWNNTETEQAIGRGIRAFSHSSLPADQKKVQVYRMASIVPGSLSDSIDLIMYKYSEDKDLIIQQILRLMKEYAVDCSLNRQRNITTDEKYDCAFVNPTIYDNPNLIIVDTYNLYYAKKDIEDINDRIHELYRKKEAYFFDELLKLLPSYPSIVILRALKSIIDSSTILFDKYGMQTYLKEQNNLYFLVDEINLPSDYFLTYYTSNPAYKTKLDFKQTILEREVLNLPKKILYLEQSNNKEYELRTKFSMIEKELILKNIISSEYTNEFVEGIYQILKPLVQEFENYIKVGEKCFNKTTKKWSSCDETLLAQISRKEKKEKKPVVELKENPYGHHGIISTKKGKEEFKIRDLNNPRSKGLACKSITKPGLIKLRDELIEKTPPDVVDEELSEIDMSMGLDEMCSSFRKWFTNKGLIIRQ